MILKNNKLLITAIIISCAYLIFLGIKLYKYQGHFSGFIQAGSLYANSNYLPPNIPITSQTGYDGQFYYYLALNPFIGPTHDLVANFDGTAFRQQRLGYPLFTYLLSLGQIKAVPYLLIVINILSLIALAYLFYQFIKKQLLLKGEACLSLTLVIYPGFLISLARNLTEILAILLMMLGYFLFTRKKLLILSILSFIFATLTRETTLILPSVISLYYFIKAIREKNYHLSLKGFLFSLPLLLFVFWQIYLTKIWYITPLFINSDTNLTWPLTGLIEGISLYNFKDWLNLVSLAYLLLIIILAGRRLFLEKKRNFILTITWLLHLIFTSLYTSFIWSEDINFYRACTEIAIFSLIIIMLKENKKIKKFVFFATLIVWLIMAIKLILIDII